MALVARTWNGLTLAEKIDRAGGRAIVGIGAVAVVETKKVTHKLTGTLARSTHMAPPGADHEEDQAVATDADHGGQEKDMIGLETHAEMTPFGPVVEVGSWIAYAASEWIKRGHPGVTQGVELSRGARADAIVKQAFREEGLL